MAGGEGSKARLTPWLQDTEGDPFAEEGVRGGGNVGYALTRARAGALVHKLLLLQPKA